MEMTLLTDIYARLRVALVFARECGLYNFAANSPHRGFSNGQHRQRDNTPPGQALAEIVPAGYYLERQASSSPTRLRPFCVLA
jgi:hypothetical protein